jgi:hypothetical protein
MALREILFADITKPSHLGDVDEVRCLFSLMHRHYLLDILISNSVKATTITQSKSCCKFLDSIKRMHFMPMVSKLFAH